MKIYKNFDEMREKVWKTIEKILRKVKKNSSVLNICWNFEKNLSLFKKILCKFWESSRFLKNSG